MHWAAGYGRDLLLRSGSDGIKSGYAMLPKRHRSEKLFSDFNTLQFASVMGIVVFVILLFLMTIPTHGYSNSVDLPKASHAISMPGALREDVLKITITRDGRVYLGTDQITPYTVREKLPERLKDHGVERKVYILADMRTKWSVVKDVLDSVRATGILRVAFLVNQRRS
jgi:biopolymer transport protein TolR